jgi:hypothetical protein
MLASGHVEKVFEVSIITLGIQQSAKINNTG